jgi:endonuclease/exonuclease/phosphatase family metal-dependent hydrolase
LCPPSPAHAQRPRLAQRGGWLLHQAGRAAQFCQPRCDRAATQEATKHRLPQLVRALGSGWTFVTSANCAILSRHKLVSQPRPNIRACVAHVHPSEPGWPELEVACVHFDHVREPQRLAEAMKLAEHLGSEHAHRIWLGDCNALTRSDASDTEWAAIAQHRANSAWEAPRSELTDLLKASPTKKRPGLRMADAWEVASPPRRSGPKGTSRFGTRIDYVFLSPGLATACNVTHCEHLVAIPHVSDHNAVVATLELRTRAG